MISEDPIRATSRAYRFRYRSQAKVPMTSSIRTQRTSSSRTRARTSPLPAATTLTWKIYLHLSSRLLRSVHLCRRRRAPRAARIRRLRPHRRPQRSLPDTSHKSSASLVSLTLGLDETMLPLSSRLCKPTIIRLFIILFRFPIINHK